MKTVGIIAEYNPFHQGHAYHIKKAKELTGATYCIVVMSGNFVQRGEPAIIDKYNRTAMALAAGADLVLELPVVYACAGAREFAEAAVAILDKTNTVDAVCFGSESGCTQTLQEIAALLVDHETFLSEHIAKEQKKGFSYPAARATAFIRLCQETVNMSKEKLKTIEAVLSSPNDILGLEYIQALIRRGSHIVPTAMKRAGNESSKKIENNEQAPNHFNSALAVRSYLLEQLNNKEHQTGFSADFNINETICASLPSMTVKLMNDLWIKRTPITANDFSLPLIYRLLTTTSEQWLRIDGVSKELANRIERVLRPDLSFEQIANELNTRQYTKTRIMRGLIRIMLSIERVDFEKAIQGDYISYSRVLGFKRESRILLTHIKQKGRLILITKMADAAKILSDNDSYLLAKEIEASHIYEAVVANKYGENFYNEYTKGLIIC